MPAGTIRALRKGGISRVVMVTGDRADVADKVGVVIGVDEVLAERTPAEKLDAVRLERRRAPTIMVGDGINDAPALALADVGVAMGARGATASSQSADAVLTVDRIDRLGEVAAVARRTGRIAMQSVIAGMGMSLAAMAVAGLGLLPAVWGALLQEGIDVAVILNALRALRQPAAAGSAVGRTTPRWRAGSAASTSRSGPTSRSCGPRPTHSAPCRPPRRSRGSGRRTGRWSTRSSRTRRPSSASSTPR